jgi:hypothetical protein
VIVAYYTSTLEVSKEHKFDCYSSQNVQTDSKEDYELHVIQIKWPKVSYPNKTSLEKKGIEGKGRPWEI